MNYSQILKTSGRIFLSLVSIIVVYFAFDPITEYLDEAGYTGLSILSNACVAVMIFFIVIWFNKKVNKLSTHEYGFGGKSIVKNFSLGRKPLVQPNVSKITPQQ